jgi:DNA-binding response OmpR family regulator
MPSARKILVADDEPLIRELILDVFSADDFEITTVRNGAEAIEELQRSHFDLLLLDVDMPIVSGFGVIDFLRTQAETSRPKVLIMTIYDDHINEVDWSIIDALIPKPFELAQLRALVKNALSDHAEHRESGEQRDPFSPRTKS